MTSIIRKKIIFAGIFLVFSVSVFLFIFLNIKNSHIKIEQKFVEWQREELRMKEMVELEKMVVNLFDEKAEIDSLFLKKDEVVFFLEYIESLSKEVGVNTKVSGVEIKEEENFLSLSLQSSGFFDDLYKFLKLLENSKYRFEFDSLSLSREGFGSGGGLPSWKMDLKMKLVTFIQ